MAKTNEMFVRDMMKTIDAVSEDTKIGKMLEILKKERLAVIPVVDKGGALVGVVAEHDLIKLVKHESPSPIGGAVWSDEIDESIKDKTVKDIMETKVMSVSIDDDIDTALKMMNNCNTRMLPVVSKEGKLLGAIRTRDVFENFLKE